MSQQSLKSEVIPTSRKSKKIRLDPENAKANQELLQNVCGQFRTVEANGFASLVNYSSLSDEPVHRWFRYREGYSLQLVKELIAGLPKGSVIVDPFCGCGTTLLAAQELGYESYGFDINPISTLVSRVKTCAYTKDNIRTIEKVLKSTLKLSSDSDADDPPALKIIGKVFSPDVLHALLIIRRHLKAVDDAVVAEFLKVAWLSILEGVSNVFKEGNGIKYRNRKRTPKGYITIPDSEWQSRLFPEDKFQFVFERFEEQVQLMLQDVRSRKGRLPNSHIIEAGAESISEHIAPNTAAYVVFSPPYCNCFNYFKIFKIELWMGEFVDSYSDIQKLNRRAMRSHVETVLEREGDVPIDLVDEFVGLVDPDNLWDQRIPRAIRGYFIDMRQALSQIYQILKPGGSCVIVVGNSAYSGIVVPTDALLANIGKTEGFNAQKISVARHLTTSSQQKKLLNGVKEYLRESLVFLEKPDPRLDEKDLVFVDELPLNVEHSTDTVFVIRNTGLTDLTHKFHRYPGKFIPHVPRWALKKYLDGGTEGVVLDPFCGSGTSNVEAIRLGHQSYAMDIDHVSRLLTKVKTTPINEDLLSQAVKKVFSSIRRRKVPRFVPQIETLSHWFNESAVRELGIIRDSIEAFREAPDIYDFLLVCFMAVIRRASNADNQTMKTYVSHTHPKTPESAFKLFEKIVPDYVQRLTRLGSEVGAKSKSVVLPYIDSREFSESWAKDGNPKVDLMVTSPPYLKTVDYVYNQMAEYFWVGDLYGMETQPKQNDKKREYIGTEKVRVSQYKEFVETGIAEIDELSARVFAKDPKHSYIVGRYFNDMQQHFREAGKVMKDGAHYVLVVGDSLINNEVVPVHELIQKCAATAGFTAVDVFGYEIRNRHMRFPRRGRGGMIRYDWIIDFVTGSTDGRGIPLETREG